MGRVALGGLVLGEAYPAVDQCEASTRVDVNRRVDRVQDAGADLRRGDRPGLRYDAPDLVACARAGTQAQRHEGREASTENQKPTDPGAQRLLALHYPARLSPIAPTYTSRYTYSA